MLSARYFNAAGEAGDPFQLPEELFDGVVHEAALHQAIKAYLANQRQGTHATKTRAMVSGGSRKAWRQKGTGRARQGSIRAPHWRGGGIVFGPSPRSYHQDVPKKIKALARRSAFNTRAANEEIAVIERFDVEAPKTKQMAALLGKMGLAEATKILILTAQPNENLLRSARNLPNVEVRPFRAAHAYEVLRAKQLIIESDALRTLTANAADEEAEVTTHA